MDVKHLFWSSGITKYGLLNVWAACIHFFPIFLLVSFFPLTTTGWCEKLSSSAVFLGYYCKWLNAPLYASLFSFGTLLPFFNFLNFLLGSFIDGVFWFSGLSFFLTWSSSRDSQISALFRLFGLCFRFPFVI